MGKPSRAVRGVRARTPWRQMTSLHRPPTHSLFSMIGNNFPDCRCLHLFSSNYAKVTLKLDNQRYRHESITTLICFALSELIERIAEVPQLSVFPPPSKLSSICSSYYYTCTVIAAILSIIATTTFCFS